ncbi:MAG: transketolase [Gemmatimonadota bacterium]|nr:transketolase [Gemmatimonadota bacterium]
MTQKTVAGSPHLDELCVNAVRVLAMDAVQAANSGHPGAPMGLAPAAYVLWTRYLRHNPADPTWPGRDRFVLSAGHASMLLYAVLHLTGYDLTLDDLKAFRQWDSRTPGHPEFGRTPGVETTTGPLGQGFANAVGMAIAEAHLAARFGRSGEDVVGHRVYFIASDGDLMEGISHEAASLAGHLRLGKLVGIYDDNHISIDGPTALSFSEDVAGRFTAYGWHVVRVEDGNDLDALDAALGAARAEVERPSLVIVRSHIGFGSPNKQDSAEAHGAPLGVEEVQLTKTQLGWPSQEPFDVPAEALAEWRKARERGEAMQLVWQQRYDAYHSAYPEPAAELERRLRGDLPADWTDVLPVFEPGDKGVATRAASGKVLNAVAPVIPELMGGSADLSPSNNTLIKGEADFSAADRTARNLRFGVREHAMGGILNGMALHGGIMPYGGTFLVFSDYMRPSIRLAAMMDRHVIYVFTHDSIGLGEDGPTHQPIEMLATLRTIPGLVVLRPADANETSWAWRIAIERRDGPVALVFTRQGVPVLDRTALGSAAGVRQGGYVLSDPPKGKPEAVLLAAGSEVHIALEAARALGGEGKRVRVVSMPSLELFAAQPAEYRESVLPSGITARVAVEAAHPQPWWRWVGDAGDVVGLDHFGASAPYQRLYQEFGITAEVVADRVRARLG